jgi:hypothetical protein
MRRKIQAPHKRDKDGIYRIECATGYAILCLSSLGSDVLNASAEITHSGKNIIFR